MEPILVDTVATVDDDDSDDIKPSHASQVPFVNYTPESDLLIAEDDLEFGETGADDVLDDSLVENATIEVLWTIPVSLHYHFT